MFARLFSLGTHKSFSVFVSAVTIIDFDRIDFEYLSVLFIGFDNSTIHVQVHSNEHQH